MSLICSRWDDPRCTPDRPSLVYPSFSCYRDIRHIPCDIYQSIPQFCSRSNPFTGRTGLSCNYPKQLLIFPRLNDQTNKSTFSSFGAYDLRRLQGEESRSDLMAQLSKHKLYNEISLSSDLGISHRLLTGLDTAFNDTRYAQCCSQRYQLSMVIYGL